MKNQSLQKFIVLCILIMLGGSLIFLSCSKDSDNDNITGGITGPQKISSGEWNANTDFGGFDLIINSESTYITKITITFDNWSIGSGTHNGSIIISRTPGWQISNRQFSISTDLNPIPPGHKIMTFNGTFHDNGNEASGTWEADFDGAADSGNWEGCCAN
ncbi:MAG: hypothetical protein P8184_18170 [Calditrichia bacterium]